MTCFSPGAVARELQRKAAHRHCRCSRRHTTSYRAAGAALSRSPGTPRVPQVGPAAETQRALDIAPRDAAQPLRHCKTLRTPCSRPPAGMMRAGSRAERGSLRGRLQPRRRSHPFCAGVTVACRAHRSGWCRSRCCPVTAHLPSWLRQQRPGSSGLAHEPCCLWRLSSHPLRGLQIYETMPSGTTGRRGLGGSEIWKGSLKKPAKCGFPIDLAVASAAGELSGCLLAVCCTMLGQYEALSFSHYKNGIAAHLAQAGLRSPAVCASACCEGPLAASEGPIPPQSR